MVSTLDVPQAHTAPLHISVGSCAAPDFQFLSLAHHKLVMFDKLLVFCSNLNQLETLVLYMFLFFSDLPDISVSHTNLTVIEGDRVTAICNGSGSPLPEVDWPVNGLHSINAQEVWKL